MPKSIPMSDQRGLVLITAVFLLLVMAILAGVIGKWRLSDMTLGEGYTKSRAAFYIAMAGVQDALNQMNYDSSGLSPGTEIGTGGMDEVLTNFVSNNSADLVGVSFGGGTFTVSIQDNDDGDRYTADENHNKLVLTSVGSNDGVTSTIEALIIQPVFVAKHAVTVGDDLDGIKALVVTGTLGSMHANDDYWQSEDSAAVSQGVTAYDTCTGSWASDSCLAGKRVREALPIINVADFKSYCDYIMKSDGTATDGNDVVIADPQATTGFTWDSADSRWENNGRDIKKGMYYFETRMYAEGSWDDKGSTNPGEVTFLSKSHVDVNDGTFINYRNPAHTEDIQNLFLVGERDVETHGKVNIGSSSNYAHGIIAAGHQVDTGGHPYLRGWIVGKDIADTTDGSNPVYGNNIIDQNLKLVYDGHTTGPFLSDKVTILSWKEK